ncbi:hypothetical protein SAMN05444162_1334 [Paenibacillaceae bacterium GAS479]|nr:hypothetical protein SAMN05444162_1334 [Paenibacillaceae bacterium GAS479]
MDVISERVSISGSGGTIGVVLVLFILVAIVTRIFSDSSVLQSSPNGDLPPVTIAATSSFTIYNQTENLSLETTLLVGDFAPPVPRIHVLNPGQSYAYSVVVSDSQYQKVNGYVRYITIDGRYIDITLTTERRERSRIYASIAVTAVEGLSYSQNVQSLFIKRVYVP